MSKESVEKVIIHPWPKMVFMWPTALMALAAGLATHSIPEGGSTASIWGGLFLTVFALNMLVITFDFPRGTVLTAVLACVAVAWLIVWLNDRFGIIQPLKDFIAGRQL